MSLFPTGEAELRRLRFEVASIHAQLAVRTKERDELLALVGSVAEHRGGDGPLELNPEFIDRCIAAYDRISGGRHE